MATAAYHAQPARPSTEAVLAYLAAGNSNADAAAHFGIHERSVRRIKQRAGMSPIGDKTPSQAAPANVHNVHNCAQTAPAARVFPPTADDTAGDHTLWLCPATGELMPVIPGTHRQAWERERRETHARHVARVMSSSADRTPDTLPASTAPDMSGHEPPSASESEMAGPDTHAAPARIGQNRTAAPSVQSVQDHPPAGIVAAYLKHQAAEVRRDGLLVLGWRWLEAHPLIGPFPSKLLVLLPPAVAVALLAG